MNLINGKNTVLKVVGLVIIKLHTPGTLAAMKNRCRSECTTKLNRSLFAAHQM